MLGLLSCVALASPLHAQTPRTRSNGVLLARAEWLLAHQRPAHAVAMLRRAIEREPRDPTAIQKLAQLVLPAFDDPRAITPDEALQRDAQFVIEAINRLAERDDSGVGDRADRLFAEHVTALVFARSLQDAVTLWSARDVRLDRTHADLGRRLAALAVARNQLPLAQRILELCLRSNAEDATLRSDLAAVALAQGRIREAVVLFREVAVAQPESLDAQRDLAGALLAEGDALTAMGLLHAARACTAVCDCALELIRTAIAARQHAIAIEAAGDALRRCDAGDPEPLLWLAFSEQQAGHPLQAKAAYRAALRRDPQSARAQAGLAGLGAN